MKNCFPCEAQPGSGLEHFHSLGVGVGLVVDDV